MAKAKRPSVIDAFLALPDEEKERQCREFDKEFIADTFRPLTPAERKLWEKAKRKRGRPRVGKGSQVISLSIESGLLAKSDRMAKKLGVSRSQLMADGLRLMLQQRPRKAG